MYSKTIESIKYHRAYELEFNGEKLLPFEKGRDKKDLIVGPLDYYFEHLKLEGQDPIEAFVRSKLPHFEKNKFLKWTGKKVFTKSKELNLFPQWYLSFLSNQIQAEIQELTVYQVKYKYENSKLIEVDRELLTVFED